MSAGEEQADTSTRDRILNAAIAITRDGAGARISVRSVAARAGVGMGTLRYHFRTQRDLLDAVLSALYSEALPDERIRDSAVPATERLQECLGHLLTGVGLEQRARDTWTELFHAFIAADAAADTRAGYLELHRQTKRRVESWLSILVEEGALDRGDNSARAEFLLTVVNGLAIQRALPSEASPLEVENTVLRTAIASLPLIRAGSDHSPRVSGPPSRMIDG
jgi:TetR/AcrR family transcriptional regulator, cholesterol catabolism regulator